MKQKTITLNDMALGTIQLGFQGENEVKQIVFDCKEAFDEYPNATPSLSVTPPEGESYPAVVTKDGDTVKWTIKNSDLIYHGEGEIQLKFTEGTAVKKSYRAKTKVGRSIEPTGEAPEPVQNWIDQATDVLEEVEDAIPAGGTTGQVLAKKSNADRDTEWVDQTGGGTSNYNDLSDKPQIGGVTLSGNKTLRDLGAAAEEDIPVVHNVPAGGSANQVLAKNSGTDYDLKWVNQSGGGGGGGAEIDDTAGEGDTGVVWSADKTWTETEELKEAIEHKAPAIINTVESAYSFDDVVSPAELNYIYSATAFGNARYANRLNYMPIVSLDTEKNGLDISVVDRTIVVDGGVASASSSIYVINDELPVPAPAGNYTFRFEVDKGSSTISFGQNIIIRAYYADGTDANLLTQLVQATNLTVNVTTNKTINKIRVEFYFTAKNTYNNHRVWIGMYPSDTVFTDVGEPVTVGETVSVTIDGITEPAVIDTVQHKSDCAYKVDTKAYIDNHTQQIDFIYFRPEDYGAKGNGVADDSAAIQACINAAQQDTNKPHAIRGYGIYKISQSITFNAREIDVFFNKINYTGNDAALVLSASFSNFEFESIDATSGGSNAVGIRCLQSQNSGYTTTFHANKLRCSFLSANGNSIEFVQSPGVTVGTIMYNIFEFKMQKSNNANIIYVNADAFGENEFHGKVISCVNGYCLYCEKQASAKLFGYCIESNAKNGLYNGGFLYQYRCRELVDKQTSENHGIGLLYTFNGVAPYGYADGTPFSGNDITSINVENAASYEDLLAQVKAYYEENPTASGYEGFSKVIPALRASGQQQGYLIVDGIGRTANANMNSGNNMVASNKGTLYAYYNHIGFKPYYEVYCTVDADMTIELTSENNYDYITPTTFDINTASAEIALDYSYCAIAINRFDVIQHENKTAIVYDKEGNKIFDGTSLGAGVYHFKCDMVELSSLSVTLEGGTVKTCPSSVLRGFYTGSNEKWTVTKENLIDAPTP